MDKRFEYQYGVNAIIEKLLASPDEIVEIMLAEGPGRPALRKITTEARQRGVTVTFTTSDVLDRMAQGQRHQGVIARVSAYSYAPFSELLENAGKQSGSEWILILDGVTDPQNLGAILRTAEAVGVRYVVIPKDRAVGVTPAVAKVSAGAIHHLGVCQVTNLRRAINAIKDLGFWIAALDAGAPKSIYETRFPEKVGVVLGSEGTGIRPLIAKESDYVLSIPMQGKVNSLNVSVAGAVFLYELLRQSNAV